MGTNVLLRGIPDYSRTLVLVDGQTLNDPYIGAVTWESVPPETIERIEAVPGSFSSLYGGSAMGGVINIITKAPTRRDVTVKAGYGTNNFKSASVLYQDRLGEGVGVMLDYAYKRSDGYIKDEVLVASSATAGTAVTGASQTTDSQGNLRYLVGDKGDAAWDSENIGAKLYMDLPGASRLTLGVSRFTYGSFDRNDFNTYLRDGSGNPVSNGNVTFSEFGTNALVREKSFLTGPDSDIKEQNRYTAEFEKQLDQGSSLKATLGYTDMPLYNNYIVPGNTAMLNGGPATRLLRPNSELAGSAQLSFPASDRHYLVSGISAGRRVIDTVTYNISDWRDADATGTIANQTAGEDRSYALYIQDEITLADRLTGYLGGRYDYWATDGFVEVSGVRTDYSKRDQSYFSPKASLVFRPEDRTTLRASMGRAFHAPVLRDTFGYWTPSTGYTFSPNPDLKPETLTSWEIGAERKVGAGTLLRATYFDNRLKDLIYRTSDSGTLTESVTNAGEARVKGVELEARRQLTSALGAFANATYNDPRITENPVKPVTEGKIMTRTPRRMANAGVQGRHGPWNGSLLAHYVGKVYANDENKDVVSGVYGSYDAHTVVNAKLSYAASRQATLSLAVDNLLDREYYESSKAMGRAVYGEIAWRWW
jgi:iron complex outermembrane receptor protein